MTTALTTTNTDSYALWQRDADAFSQAQRMAKMMCSSSLVPQHFRGDSKVGDMMLVLATANRMGEDPLTVAQNIYIVSGKAGWGATYLIARANRSGKLTGGIDWQITGEGEALEVEAFATTTDGRRIAATASMAMAKAEGWTKNPKYRSMPEVMLRYRAATLLVRFYLPEIMLGLSTADEIEDIGVAEVVSSTPSAVADLPAYEPAAEPEATDAEIVESKPEPVESTPAPAKAPTLPLNAEDPGF